jgi:hypothetical protein
MAEVRVAQRTLILWVVSEVSGDGGVALYTAKFDFGGKVSSSNPKNDRPCQWSKVLGPSHHANLDHLSSAISRDEDIQRQLARLNIRPKLHHFMPWVPLEFAHGMSPGL